MSQYLIHILLCAASALLGTNAILITTSNGTVQGDKCSTTDSNYFLAIPFADPPVGEFRFQGPKPYSGSYNGTLDGTQPAPFCYQFGNSGIEEGAQSEDWYKTSRAITYPSFANEAGSLYLNVYAPANATSESKLPVKLWLYGGAFVTGASTSPLYDGCFASNDAVIVTANYRLGPLGYLALENTTLSGNYGALDQLQAIEWVHDNIIAFGGNPEEILLFGQSAGAISSFVLATLPQIKPLIKAVIMESGGGYDLATIATAQPFHVQFVGALNCATTDVNCIRSKTPAELNATLNQIATKADTLGFAYTLLDRSGAIFPWGPTVETSLLPVQPSEVGVQVPAIFGSNGREDSIFTLQDYGVSEAANLTLQDYNDFLDVNFGPFAPNVSRQYPLASFGNNVFEAVTIVGRDASFRCAAYRGASRAAAKGIPVWTYNFNQTLSCPWAQGLPADLLPILGAAHTAEIVFAFGEVDNLPSPDGNCSLSAGEQNISTYMQSSWTNMARNAEPGNQWPRFSPGSSLGINFEAGIITPGVVDYSMCGFWDNLEAVLLESASTGGNTNSTAGASPSAQPSMGSASTTVPSAGLAFAAIMLSMLSTF